MTTFVELLEEIENQQKSLQKLHDKVIDLVNNYKGIESVMPKEKTYTWEDSFSREGFYLAVDSEIEHESLTNPVSSNRNIATTEKVIKSYLAACMLSHIIEAINKDFDNGIQVAISANRAFKNNFQISDYNIWELPYLNSIEAAECLIKHHTPLLNQLFGVE